MSGGSVRVGFWVCFGCCLAGAGLSPAAGEGPLVVINEIMYHPPEDSDALQYVELHNPGSQRIRLDGWSFDKGIRYRFTKKDVISPGGFVLLAKDPRALAAHYDLDAKVMGPFEGRLSHSGERLRLIDGSESVVDEVTYQDRNPWPRSPDGYSSSLERVDPTRAASEAHQWAPSTLLPTRQAGGSPGIRNTAFSLGLRPRVTELVADPQWPGPGETIEIRFRIPDGEAADSNWKATLEFSDSVGRDFRPEMTVACEQKDGVYRGTLPAQETGTLLRYRVRLEHPSSDSVVWPAEEEVRPAWSLYVADSANVDQVGHGFLINGAAVERGVDKFHRASRQRTRPEPSRGYGAFVYYAPGAAAPQLFDFIRVTQRAGGLKLRFHADQPMDEMTVVNILSEGKSRYALSEYLSFELFRRAGVPAPKAGHIRFFIDGRPRGYFLTVEQPNRSFLKRNQRDADGNMYKILWFGRGVVDQHEKKTNRHEGHDDVVDVIRQLGRLRGERQWAYIDVHFNVEEFASYFAVNMCISNWDGFFNNYFTYHDTGGTGKWEIYPWDEDKTWGDYDGASSEYNWYEMPITSGMKGDRSPPQRFFGIFGRGPFGGTAWWRPPGYMSGPLLANPKFRAQFLDRLAALCAGTFTEKEFLPVIDALEKRLLPEVAWQAELRRRSADSETQRFRASLDTFRSQLKYRREFLLKAIQKERR